LPRRATGLVRLQASPSILGSEALSTTASWNLVAELQEDERVEFVPEPPGLDALLPDCLAHHGPAARLVNDAYLAAFAMASGRRLATLDRGFRRFAGLQLALAEP
jgi:predicted nucleic acid-binding protein